MLPITDMQIVRSTLGSPDDVVRVDLNDAEPGLGVGPHHGFAPEQAVDFAQCPREQVLNVNPAAEHRTPYGFLPHALKFEIAGIRLPDHPRLHLDRSLVG